jgi:hypothetical protein
LYRFRGEKPVGKGKGDFSLKKEWRDRGISDLSALYPQFAKTPHS